MKYATNSLSGARLARAVWECLRVSDPRHLDAPPPHLGHVFLTYSDIAAWRPFRPDAIWAHGGPIVEQEDIGFYKSSHGYYQAAKPGAEFVSRGPTPLVAEIGRAHV